MVKRIFHLASVALVVLVSYAFIFSNSVDIKQDVLNLNGQCNEQFSSEQICFGSNHFGNSPTGIELIDVEGNGTIQSSEPQTIRNHRSCKTLRFDLPIEVLPTLHAILSDSDILSPQPHDFPYSNYVTEQYTLRI